MKCCSPYFIVIVSVSLVITFGFVCYFGIVVLAVVYSSIILVVKFIAVLCHFFIVVI